MKGIEDAETALHAALRVASAPRLTSPAEGKKFYTVHRGVQKAYEDLEELRMDLEEWIYDYEEHTKAKQSR